MEWKCHDMWHAFTGKKLTQRNQVIAFKGFVLYFHMLKKEGGEKTNEHYYPMLKILLMH